MSNTMNVETYRWRCAALSASEMAAFTALTHGAKRTTPAKAHNGAVRAWNGPMT